MSYLTSVPTKKKSFLTIFTKNKVNGQNCQGKILTPNSNTDKTGNLHKEFQTTLF